MITVTDSLVTLLAAEGGEDAKMLVRDQFTVYGRYCIRRGL